MSSSGYFYNIVRKYLPIALCRSRNRWGSSSITPKLTCKQSKCIDLLRSLIHSNILFFVHRPVRTFRPQKPDQINLHEIKCNLEFLLNDIVFLTDHLSPKCKLAKSNKPFSLCFLHFVLVMLGHKSIFFN